METRKLKKGSLPLNPTESSLEIINKAAENIAPDTRDFSQWHDAYINNHRLRIALDLDIAKNKVKEGSSILEFGSAPPLLTVSLDQCGFNVTGVDIAPERYMETIENTGITVTKCNIELQELPFDNDAFDSIIFNELFEHLRIDPIFTLSEAFRVLKPDGTFMLSTPNLKSLDGIINFIFKDENYSCSGNVYSQYRKLYQLGHMGHAREYTITEVVEFLDKIGFTVEEVLYRGGFRKKWKKLLSFFFPRLKPFVSFVARKRI